MTVKILNSLPARSKRAVWGCNMNPAEAITAREAAWDTLLDIPSKHYFSFDVLPNLIKEKCNINISANTAANIIKEWARDSYIIAHQHAESPQKYRRAETLPLLPPVICKTSMDIWRTMRMLKNFTVDDIARETGIKNYSIDRIVTQYRKAGYLKKISMGNWKLIDDTGQLPPRIMHLGSKIKIFDRNTKEVRYDETE